MPEERAALATSLAREGHDGKACAALLGRGGRGGPGPGNSVAALKALQPVQPDPVTPPVHDTPAQNLVPDTGKSTVMRARWVGQVVSWSSWLPLSACWPLAMLVPMLRPCWLALPL